MRTDQFRIGATLLRYILITALRDRLFLALPVMLPVAVHAAADLQGNLCAGANLDVTNPDCTDTNAAPDRVNEILTAVINIFSIVVGIVAVIMIIVGGLKYITSAGDSGNVTGAKNTILYAIVGLIIVALAQVIVKFVLAKTASTS